LVSVEPRRTGSVRCVNGLALSLRQGSAWRWKNVPAERGGSIELTAHLRPQSARPYRAQSTRMSFTLARRRHANCRRPATVFTQHPQPADPL